jgi:outer membrane protein assembly factor BamD (BamD/ComL family)
MKSFVILMFSALILAGCSRSADKLYSDGTKAEGEKQYDRAAQAYEDIIARFPMTAYAESSLSRLAVLYNNDLKDPHKALGAYKRFYTMFPQSTQAPTMLFLSGFIYNNDLHLYDSAKSVYETFLQKYPTHELAQSAKFELETLGKDPGQALNSRMATAEDVKPEQPKRPKAAKQ